MPRPKRKPDYDGEKNMEQLIVAVCDYFGTAVDDREPVKEHVSLREVAERFHITVIKARKILITAGLYSTAASRKVQALSEQGMTLVQITEATGLKRSSVNSYIPYTRTIYKLPDVSIQAERQKQYRVRGQNAARTDAEKAEKLWQELTYLQGCLFTTSKGLDFTYRIKGLEMFVDRKEKSITKATALAAYRKVVELGGVVKGPKQLGTFGASYLYPVFVKMGIIKTAGD